MRRGWAALGVVAGLATTAHAGSDYRWHDRFFFEASGGVVKPFDDAGGGGEAFAFGISYWTNDYLGAAMNCQLSSASDDWGVLVLGAVPMRYVQVYGGPFLGFRNPRDRSDGANAELHLTVGINAYVGRNLRPFVQLEGDAQADVLLAGLRWSPDFFHAARGTNKLDSIWWTMMLTAGVWGIANAAQ